MKQNLKGSVLILLAAFFLGGCAAGGMKDVSTSGFLDNYSQLKYGDEDKAALVYINPNADFKLYDKIMFDRVMVVLSNNADSRAIDPALLKELADYQQQALLDAVQGGYQVVDQPGSGVLRVRMAITELKPSKPVANTMSTILPVGWVVSGATKAASDDNMGTGEAGAEMELLDALTGERLAAAVDKRQGGKMAFRGKWTDSKDAMEYWAKKLRQRLDSFRGM